VDDNVILDWSFIFVLVMLAILITGLALRSRKLRRRQKYEERRAAKRAFNDWLASSSQAMELQQRESPPPER
jgi:hypothetical protein